MFSLLLFWLAAFTAQAQTTADLSVHKLISNQSPAIGDVVSYTVIVSNAVGSATATNITVKDELPVAGVSYVPSSASTIVGAGNYTSTASATSTVGTWSISSIAGGDSAVLVLRATVLERGVWFNSAEVTAVDQTDADSQPNNQSLVEDDYDAVCFSVPILYYPGDEYTVSIPPGYDQIVWYRNDEPISTTSVSTTLATVNDDLSLTIKSPGVYRFVTFRNGCPATNCCNIEVIPGPYGSLGDYVFVDTNQNGVQDDGATGLDGVTVYLYDETGTTKIDSTVTAGGGKYLFDNLISGNYTVQFVALAGFQSTSANAAGAADDLDSDAGTNGFTGVYTIDTTQPESSTARNNLTVDAGFTTPNAPASLGDLAFIDTNGNGVQDGGEAGLAGVTVTLYQNGSAVASLTTDVSGIYSFTGLASGSSFTYAVGFTPPTGYTATTPLSGTGNQLASLTLGAGETNLNQDAGFQLVPNPASLGDQVFADANGNGILDAGETGLAGVVVTLYQNGSAVTSLTTDATGAYSFTGLTPGSSFTYAVGFTAPTGYTATTPLSGTAGLLASLTLAPGETNNNQDAGFLLQATPVYDVAIAKNVVGNGPFLPSSFVTYELTVTNNSNVPVYNVALTDQLPAEVSFVSGAGFGASGANSVSAVIAGPLSASGGVASLTLTAQISGTYSASLATNQIAITAFTATTDATGITPVDTDPTNNTASVSIPVGNLAAIGDFVFEDANGNGVQDTGETGLAGVVVTLYQNGSAVANLTTDATGLYSFTGLTPGSSLSYAVGFTAPAGLTATLSNQGDDDINDSDVNPLTGLTQSVTLVSGEYNQDLDAGFFGPASLGDQVFADANGNGVLDGGETGLAGVVVTLYQNGSAVASLTTDASGVYSFTGLTPGSSFTYAVGFTGPTGYTATTPLSGTAGLLASLTLGSGETNNDQDAGFQIIANPASLGDLAFIDTNGNGVQDGGETGLAGVVVTLYQNGSAVATTTTDASGIYSFSGLTSGSSFTYAVGFTAPLGYTATTPLSGTAGQLASLTLAPGQINLNQDAGFLLLPNLASLGDQTFVDTNGNGVQDSGELGLTGVEVTLYLNGNAVATTTTDPSGVYSFSGLTPGSSFTYAVGFTAPAGYTATTPLSGTAGLLASLTLAPGESNLNQDAGFQVQAAPLLASLGDQVYEDPNGNGVLDAGETGLAGVVVTLYQNGSAVTSLTTDASGTYSFTGLTPGNSFTYAVGFTAPLGYTATTPLSGTAGLLASLTLGSGETNNDQDAGFQLVPNPASLGDQVFADANGNGILDAGETGLAGVVVTLYQNGSAVTSLTTDASGTYSFTGLTPGSSFTYAVGFTAPLGYTATTPLSGTAGQLASLTLAPGQINLNQDAGFLLLPNLASLGDQTFVDTNGNGVQDSGELGLTGVEVTLYLNGNAVATTTTNPSGIYSFTGLTPGSSFTYSVGFTAPAGYTATTPLSGTAGLLASLTLAPGESNLNQDAGFQVQAAPLLASLGDFIFTDTNGNGLQDTGELGVGGVTVTLYTSTTAGPTLVSSTTSTAAGAYSFTGLTPGVPYYVIFDPTTLPAGFTLTTPLSGADRGLDSDADPITGQTASLTLAPGDTNNTIDAGLKPNNFDLALSKQLVSTGPFARGDQINYVLTLSNQGNVTAYNVDVTDRAPAGLILLPGGSFTNVTSTSAVATVAGPLQPGASVSLTVVAQIDPQFTGGSLQNVAEITAADNNTILGDEAPIDDDSRPGNGNPNEDDRGFADVPVGAATIQLSIVDPAVCNPLTNVYSTTGSVTLTGSPSGTLVITDNGVVALTVSVTAGQASVDFSLTGISGTPPTTHTVVATLATLTSSTTYAVPPSCTACSPIALGPVSLIGGQVNTAYSQAITATGGVGPYTYAVSGSSLPAGLSLNPATGVISGTPTSATLTAFTIVVTDSRSCSGTAPYSLTIGTNCPTDFGLVASNDASICPGESLTLTASSSASGATIRWYLTPTDGTAFATAANGGVISVTPTATTTYYAEAVTTDGCVSVREPVSVTVTTIPTPIIAGNARNACPATTVNLTQVQITNQTPGLTYEWYTNPVRSQASLVTNLTAVGAGTFYLFAKSASGCYSDPTVLTVQIVDCNCQNVAGVNVGPGVAVCGGDVIPLRAVLSGSATSVIWSSNGTGTFSNPNSLSTTYTPSTADINSGSVLLTATTNDPDGAGVCSVATSSLIAQINKRPDAPFGVACDDTLVCQGSSTKLIGFAPGNRINWYDQSNQLVGTTESGGKLVVTPTAAGRIVYSAEAVSADNCVSSRTSLTITVGTCLADLAVKKQIVTAGPYSIGQKVVYAITVSNNGPITGTAVKVTDLLPAALAYVSSTPAGEYNAGTGIWTIGTLTSGSNRSLLIETTINSIGAIRNVATVSGANNDLGRIANDTSSATIQTIQCNVQAPVIACATTEICAGGSTTLQATGCAGGIVKWSDGQTGLTVSVTPGITTTYSASCVIASCTSVASNPITVTVLSTQTPTITASADKVCPGTSVTLTASGCVGGVIEWSENRQTGASIVVAPFSKTTYTALCRVGSCLSQPATKTIDMATDLPTPTIVCSTTVVCPGETVTLTVNNCVGSPVWSSTTETTGSIVVTPTVGNNTYSVYCKNGACSSKPSPTYTINIVAPVIPTVTASADSVCAGGLVSLTATGCAGTVVWNVAGKTGPVITVNPDASISYYAQCRVRACLSDRSNVVPVTVLTPSAPIISADKTLICSGDKVTLTAEGCAGTVKWSGLNVTGASIQILPTETKEYFATCVQGACVSDASNRIRITVNTSGTAAPVIAASSTSVCSGGVVSLTATGCTGTVIWNVPGLTGSVVSTTATPTNNEFYAVCKVGTQCGSTRSNTIRVNVTPLPTPTVTCSTDSTCSGERVTLTVNNCQGTPYWSTLETTRTIVVAPTATTAYSVYCQDGVCKSERSIDYTITVVPVAVPTITASATAVEPGGTITLTATGCAGQVIWSANDINGNNIGASLVFRPDGSQTYYAQCRVRACLSDPSNTIQVNRAGCAVRAGTLAPVSGTVCADTSQLTVISAVPNGGLVQPAGYSVVYVLTKGSELIVQQTSATPTFSVPSVSGDYTIHTLVYSADPADKNYLDLSAVKPGISTGADVIRLIADRKVCAELDVAGAKVKVRLVEAPKLYASALTVCYGTKVTIGALGCEGGVVKWSDGSIGQTIEKVVYSDLWLMATCIIDGCSSEMSHSIDVLLGTPGMPTIASNRPPVVCTGETVTLTAMGCQGGTYVWSDDKTVGSTLTVTPTADVSYRVRCKIGDCLGEWSPFNQIKVGTPAAPTISVAGTTATSTTACFGAPVTLTAQGCPANTYVTWSNDLVGTSITVSLANSVTYTARCCTSASCKSAPSNPVAITVLPKVSYPVTIDRTNVCPFNTVDLATGITSTPTTPGGVFEYYTSETLSSESKVVNPAAVGSGTYYVVEKTVNGCYSLPGVIHVLINGCGEPLPCDPRNPATASAGADASICAAKTYQLNGVIGGAGKVAHWTTTGSGTFSNPYAANAIYTASAEDVLSGKVTLTLSVSTNNATCPVAKDDMVLTVEGSKSIPTVKVIGATTFCYGDSVTLQAPAGATYLWSNKAKTQSIVVKSGGDYSVQLFDQKGCSSVKSEDVTVTVSSPITTPLASNLRNACPAVIANLTSALSSTTAGSTYEYRTGATASSGMVMRPDSVGAGTFYVFEKNAAGCTSAPAKVVVSIFNCAADSLKTDVSITKTASTAAVKNGEPVTYTIKVTNTGLHTANNIDVRDVLPKGLELVPATAAGYSVSDGVITKRIDSLVAGQSDSIVFSARLLTKGEVVNKAEITYLDQVDTNLANNSSSVTVKDTSAGKPSLVGLAKSVLGTPTAIGDSLINVRYSFVLTNFGDDTLRHVQVTDDLAYFFVPNTIVATTVTPKGTSPTLFANPAFTGRGNDTNLFDSTSYLSPGRSQTFTLDVTVRRAAGDTTQTFKNIASVTAQNSVTTVSDLSTSGGDSDPDGDGDPTNNTEITSFTLGVAQPGGPSIGLALAVVKVEKQADSSYNVTYKATIKNFGDVDLVGISLTDSLVKAFTAPSSYTVVGTPVVGAGSSLVVNAGFDGNAQPNILANTSQLAAGEQDTVLITVNIKPNGNNGPFYTSATVVGQTADSSQTVTDISNDGLDPTPVGAVSTGVRFDLPSGLLGVAKAVGAPTLVEEGVYDVPYTITLSNLGTVTLKNVQVVDNLSETFNHGALIVSNQVAVAADAGLTVDSLYSGQGLVTNMLVDSLSELPVGASRSLTFIVRVDVRNADSLTFYNTAKATALTPDNQVVEDMSTAGTNDDPDNDLDPRNNSKPTPVALNNLSTAYIGVAMAVRDTVRQIDGSFAVTYQIVVKNYGSETLTGVTISDSLSKVFNSQTGSSYTVSKAPYTTSTGSALTLNPNFDGAADSRIVIGDSISSLAAGKTDTILVTLNVVTDGSTTTFLNTAYAEAIAKSGKVYDVSTNGLVPDLNGNNNPTDLNEREATPLSLPPVTATVFIPQGFSPNGDGINDLFVIRGATGLTISLEVYNRWGHLVYKNDDYQNDWDSKPNTGISVASDASGLPDGTYYYVIKTSDGRKFVRYMTINR